jgi:SH3-like domain-containing protein
MARVRFGFFGVFIAGAVAVAGGGTGHAQQMVSVERDGLNMRAGPGTRFEALWILDKGYPLRVLRRSGRWLQIVDFEGDRGWVFRALTSTAPRHVVKALIVNLRARPSMRSPVLGQLKYGDVLRTLEKRPGWVRVQQESGRRGWVARNFVWGW